MRTCFLLLVAATLWAADGLYSGKWSSSRNDTGGDIRLKITAPPEVTFSLNGLEVKTAIARFKTENAAEGMQLEIEYDFALDGYKLRSSLKGVAKAGKVKGEYTTKSLEDGAAVDAGNFEAEEAK